MKVLNKVIIGSVLFMSSLTHAKISQTEYVNTWSDVAVQQMLEHGVPASITMAQGILESAYGNSTLAVKANNHFGIKCHSDWKGKKVYHDDDKKGECFRKYPSATESFTDHSLFLTTKSRYASLFELKRTNYKGWAKGLRKAGYATNPKYADLLIDLIERLDLDELDKKGSYELIEEPLPMIAQNSTLPKEENEILASNFNSHVVSINESKTKYVLSVEGDTYYRIAKEFSLNIRQVYRYNDVASKEEILAPGTKVYVMPKRNRSKNEEKVQVSSNDLTLRILSQEKGIRLKSLLEYNKVQSPDALLAKGETIFLRK